jgi:hypothetical protein
VSDFFASVFDIVLQQVSSSLGREDSFCMLVPAISDVDFEQQLDCIPFVRSQSSSFVAQHVVVIDVEIAFGSLASLSFRELLLQQELAIITPPRCDVHNKQIPVRFRESVSRIVVTVP